MSVSLRRRISAVEPLQDVDACAAVHVALSGVRIGSGGHDGGLSPLLPLPAEEKLDLPSLIETEIIPRLLLAHRSGSPKPAQCADSRRPPTPDEIAELASLAVRHDLSGALVFIEAMCVQGLSLESVLLELVGPTARLLGDDWNDDRRSFTEVSAGLGTLQQVVHVLGPSFAPAMPHRGLVVLLAAPGEQHTLGLHLTGEFLRRAGWGVHIDPNLPGDELIELVSTRPVQMVGFTVSNDHLLEPLAKLIAAVRRASCSPGLAVLVGGGLELAGFSRREAALHAKDARDAVRFLELHAKGNLRELEN